MKLFGLTISRQKDVGTLTPVSSYNNNSFWGVIRESFSGAWQKNITADCQESLLAFSAVYACVGLIAGDIAKLRIKLVKQQNDGTWLELARGDEQGAAFLPVLTKPNRYQTRIQFLAEWITMKLLHGNTYAYKERDNRGVVRALYILDSRRVKVLVASDGAVYYELGRYDLAGLRMEDPIVIPASEIIHDRMITLWHPLVGITPIYACGASATQGTRIQANSAKFFENMSRTSGHLSAPGNISAELLASIKAQVEAAIGGENIGRMLVTSNGMKYEPMSIPAADAQLIEQQRWTVEDVARCFHVPLHKMGSGQNPTFNNVSAMNQDYYSQALQIHIESIELLLDEALDLPKLGYGTELDLDGLLRMDPATLAVTLKDLIGAGLLAPNEGRLKVNYPPVTGGDSPYLQVQNYSLEALSKRDSQADPFASSSPAPTPATPAEPTPPAKDLDAERAMKALIAKFSEASLEETIDA